MYRLPHPAPQLLATHLTNHDARSKSSQFAQTSYTCSICISTLKGARCLQLDCGHVFCRSCLDEFWSMCITEGDVGRVGCPSPECVKESREAGEEEVRRAVTEDKVVRWKWLRRKRALEQGTAKSHPMSAPLTYWFLYDRPIRDTLPDVGLSGACSENGSNRVGGFWMGQAEDLSIVRSSVSSDITSARANA